MRVESWKMSIEKSKQSVHSRAIGVINHGFPDEGQDGGRQVEKEEWQGSTMRLREWLEDTLYSKVQFGV